MNTYPSRHQTIASFLAAPLKAGSSLQVMPLLENQRVTFTSTSAARWYAIDPDLKDKHAAFLRKHRRLFDEFADSCLAGFRRIFPLATRTSTIATAGQIVEGEDGADYAGDIVMIEYQDGMRRYVPYRKPFGVTQRLQNWNMVSVDIQTDGATGQEALNGLIKSASKSGISTNQTWRLSVFGGSGTCSTGTINLAKIEKDTEHVLHLLPTKKGDDLEPWDPFVPVY